MLADQGCICGREKEVQRLTDRCGLGSLDEDKIALNEFCKCRGGNEDGAAVFGLVLNYSSSCLMRSGG